MSLTARRSVGGHGWWYKAKKIFQSEGTDPRFLSCSLFFCTFFSSLDMKWSKWCFPHLHWREEPGGKLEGEAWTVVCWLLCGSLVWGGGMDEQEVEAIALTFALEMFLWGSNGGLETLDLGEVSDGRSWNLEGCGDNRTLLEVPPDGSVLRIFRLCPSLWLIWLV